MYIVHVVTKIPPVMLILCVSQEWALYNTYRWYIGVKIYMYSTCQLVRKLSDGFLSRVLVSDILDLNYLMCVIDSGILSKIFT